MKKLLQNPFVLTTVKKGVTILSGATSLMIISRYLGPTLRGEYMYLVNMVIVLTTIFNLGISLIYPQMRKRWAHAKELFISYSILQFALYFIAGVIFILLTNNLLVGSVLLVSAVSILNLQATQINLVENLAVQTWIMIGSAVVNVLLLILASVLTAHSMLTIFIIYGLKSYVSMFCSLCFLCRKSFRFRFFSPSFGTMTRLAFVPLLTSILVSINYQADILLLKWMSVDFYQIGLYSAGVALAEYAWMVPDIFKEVMYHLNARKDNIEKMTFSLRASMTILSFIAIIMLCFGKEILIFLFSSSYANAYSVLIMMFMAVPFMVYVKIIGTLFSANGGWGYYFLSLGGSVFLNIVLNLILVPLFGIEGSALASIISYANGGIMMMIWFKRKYHVPIMEILFLLPKDWKLLISYLSNKTKSSL
ncbi:polysaccharide biosynthesis C-terminal domain-containing protein [Listeria sp. PSOL-1]|uniref:polysaccharide biosynthesis C-terminal domain-containing protein n=1 Tax=Listeria sp. PSOL-1 TaxID=1844999 RepID=UPI0013D6A14D|nr:polysaccharide biosynthesis C-terminal domain-containing protein [Listeria sp. PSOL-1]